MDKKYIAVFKKTSFEVDDFDKVEIEEKISAGKRFIFRGMMLNPSDFKFFKEVDVKSPTDILMENYLNGVKERLSMLPEERAEKTIGHFSFWYYVVFGKGLDSDKWEKVKPIIKSFYDKNPNYIYPPVKFYFEIVKGAKNKSGDKNGIAILERVEANLISFRKNNPVDNSDLTF